MELNASQDFVLPPYRGKAVVLALIGLLLAAGCVQPTGKASGSREILKVGVSTPLTGDAAEWGEEVEKGLLLAEKELNAKGGVLGKKIELVFEDDKCEPTTGLTVYRKLVDVDKVGFVLGSVCSSVVLSTAPSAEKDKVVLLSTGASAPSVRDAGDYVFSLWPLDDADGKASAEYAISKDYRKAAIIFLKNPYGEGLKDVFMESFESAGGEVVAVEGFELNAKDFRAQMTKAKGMDADVVYAAANPQEAPYIALQAKEFGLKTQLLGNFAFDDDSVQKIAGSAINGVVFTVPEQLTSREFKEKFLAEYGKKTGVVSPVAFDTLLVFREAVELAGSLEPEKVKDALYKVKVQGVSGEIVFDKDGTVFKPPKILEYVNGKKVEAS